MIRFLPVFLAALFPVCGSFGDEPPSVWLEDLDEAFHRAQADYQPVLILFYREGCRWTNRLREDVFATPDIRAQLDEMILVRIDLEQEEETAARYRIRGSPTLVFTEPDGNRIGIIEGYLPADELRPRLDELFPSEASGEVGADAAPRAADRNLREILAYFGDREIRNQHLAELLERTPFPRKELVSYLEDERLAVRLAALEILERASGDGFDYDPWLPPAEQSSSLDAWHAWAEEGDTPRVQPFTPLTEGDVRAGLSELFSQDRPRSRRAFARLRDGGLPVAAFLRNYLAENPDLDRRKREIVREVQYAILLEAIGLDRPSRRAHELVHGQSNHVRETLETLGEEGPAAAEILTDFLGSGDSLVREAAVEALTRAVGTNAVPAFADLLLREGDREVIIVTLKSLGKIETPESRALIRGFLNDSDEEIVIAALQALTELGLQGEVPLIRTALADERWRVRVAAIEAAEAAELSAVTPEVLELLFSEDTFVRTTAAKALRRIGGRSSVGPMAEAFVANPSARIAIANTFDSLNQTWTAEMRTAASAAETAQLVALLGIFEPQGHLDWEWVRTLAVSEEDDIALAAQRIIAEEWFEDHTDTDAILDFFNKEDENSARLIFRHLDLHSAGEDRSAVTELGPLSFHGSRGPVLHASFLDILVGGDRQPDNRSTEADLTALAEVGRHWMVHGDNAEIRRDAAVFLLGLGDNEAVQPLLADWESLSHEQRERLAESLEGLSGTDFFPVVERLLLDSHADIRTAMVRSMRDGTPDREWMNRYLAILNTPGSPLLPREGYRRNIREAHEEDFRRHLLPMIRNPLSDDHLAFALDGWFLAWQEGDDALLKPFFDDPRPAIRRAAWILALRVNASPEHPGSFDFASLVAAADPSLRSLYALFQQRDGFSYRHILPSGSYRYDYHYSSFSRGFRRERQPINPVTLKHLEILLEDPAPEVAGRAVVALYSHGEKIDPAKAYEIIERAAASDDSIRRDLASVFINTPDLITRDDAPLAPVLDSITYSEDRVAELRRTMGVTQTTSISHDEASPTPGSLLDHAGALRPDSAPDLPTGKRPPQPTMAAKDDAPLDLVFFTQSGCPDCRRVSEHLDRLREAFPDLVVHEYDIREVDAMRFNEALAEQRDFPERLRLTAPALFTAQGFLTRDQISFEAIARLIQDATGHSDREWLVVGRGQESESSERIERRFDAFTPGIVVGAGLLDGLNPCAFATIIFFLSYLQVARRTPVQILQVGMAFVLGIFLTYFAVGFGFLNIVARLAIIEDAARVVNWVLAGVVFVILILSLRDGFLCLRGRLRDTTLQLPKPLKKLVNATIRKGVRHSRFVLAALVTGAVIALLELACTGQVYAPTIAFVIQSGTDRPTALLYLLLYNLAFILPLLIIMILAYRGLKSDRLQAFFQRNVALLKFGNAALFALLLGFFLIVLV